MKFDWQQDGAGWRAEIGNVTVVAAPDNTTAFGTKPKRGTSWHAQCSQFDGKFTISRYGVDRWGIANAKDARKAAEEIYRAQKAKE